jgi:hypothetical protein
VEQDLARWAIERFDEFAQFPRSWIVERFKQRDLAQSFNSHRGKP